MGAQIFVSDVRQTAPVKIGQGGCKGLRKPSDLEQPMTLMIVDALAHTCPMPELSTL